MISLRRGLGLGLAISLVVAACGGPSGGTDPTATVSPPAAEPGTSEDPAATAADVDGERFRFQTVDDVELTGTLFGGGTRGIVLAHMRGRDETTWFDFARAASAEGYAVLTFNFRGYGDSKGDRDTNLDLDLIAALNLLESTGVTQTVVMGASMGATATINVASRVSLAGAVSLSAPADFIGLEALDVVTQVVEPLLLVVAENDQPYADAAASMGELAPNGQLHVFDGNSHGTNLFADHEAELEALLLEFAAERLGTS